MQGNENAKKPEDEKIVGKGRIVIDLGDLKTKAVRASRARGMKFAPWVREAIEEKVERENRFECLEQIGEREKSKTIVN